MKHHHRLALVRLQLQLPLSLDMPLDAPCGYTLRDNFFAEFILPLYNSGRIGRMIYLQKTSNIGHNDPPMSNKETLK